MLVTFPVFSHHLRCSQELCLTFEVPSGGPSDEQQPVYLTFYKSHPHILSALAPSLPLPNSPVSSKTRVSCATSCTCRRPRLPRELACLSRLYRLSDKDGRGELTVQPDFQTVKMDGFYCRQARHSSLSGNVSSHYCSVCDFLPSLTAALNCP